jgi:hypothetical protein
MKPWFSQKRRGRRAAPRLSLFPFLAVLICTMGALVLLLLTVTRQARLQAVRIHAAKNAEKQLGLKSQRETVRRRIDELEQAAAHTRRQLADARSALGHVADHGRRLRGQLTELQAASQGLEAAGADRHRGQAAQEELRQADLELTRARGRLTEAQQAAQCRPHSYAVVPYEGPNQTHRHPLYLECRSDAVVLQPENIAFTEADFDGPMGPGNPLVAALQAARGYLARHGESDPKLAGESYPLLLVRPSGIAAYAVARGALKSWDSEFGYELIEDDWKLDFQPPDAGLTRFVTQAIAAARIEQQRLIAAAPSQYGKRPAAGQYRVGPRGGSGPDDAPGDGEDSGTGFYASRPAERYGTDQATANPGGSGAGGYGSGLPGGVSSPAGGPGGYGLGGMAGGPGGSSPGGGLGGFGMSGTAGGPGGNSPGGGLGGFGVGGTASGSGGGTSGGLSGTSQSGPAFASGASAGGGLSGQPAAIRPDGYVAGRPADGQPPPADPARTGQSADPSQTAQPGTLLRPGEWHASDEYAPPPKRNDDSDDKNSRKSKRNLAESRDPDWALRNAGHGSTPLTRPIRVDCYPDRLVLVPEPGYGNPKAISLPGSTAQAIDKFVAAVWEHMDTWGIAGKGMYWHPILNVYVAPGGQRRLEDLDRLLRGSGLTIERKT